MPKINPEDCSHSHADKEFIFAQRTGEYRCDACGESWMSRASMERDQIAYTQRQASKTSIKAIHTIPESAHGKNDEITSPKQL